MSNEIIVSLPSLDGVTKPKGEKWSENDIPDAAAWIPTEPDEKNASFHMLTRSKLKVLFWLNECEMSVRSLHYNKV